MGQTCPTKQSYAREWKLAKQAASNCNKNFAKEIKTVQTAKEGLTGQQITKWLSCSPNFIGCFAENELEKLTITSFNSINVKLLIELVPPLMINISLWKEIIPKQCMKSK